MKLPNANRARVDKEKILNYLLCREHPDGGSKAKFFKRFGFDRGEWELLADALRRHAEDHEVAKMVETGYGRRYIINGTIRTADGRNPVVRTVWVIDEGSELPRLVTAHPIEKPK